MVAVAEEEKHIAGFSVMESGDTNVLGLVVVSIVLGLVIGNMGQEGLPVRNFIDSLQTAILKIVVLVIWSVNQLLLSA